MIMAVRLLWLVVAVTVISLGAAAPTSPPLACVKDDATREQARAIMLDAFDLALKNHTQNLFEVFVKEPGAEPRRARAGLHLGVSAYNRSRNAVLGWHPPLCTGDGP